nr:protein MEI2-like 4 isoform X1 [Ipomoea batatas]
MPSQMVDPHSLSPTSFFSEEMRFHDERPVSFWKSDSLSNYHGLKTDETFRGGVPSSIEEQKVNGTIEKHAIRLQKAASYSLPRTLNNDLGARSIFNTESALYSTEGDKLNMPGTQHENGLFSSSLSELFSKNLQLSTNNFPHGNSAGAAAASHYEEEEPLESLEELEAQAIGDLLPDDDDLLSGVTDGLDCVHRSYTGEEDLDLFSSVGGMDLGEDDSSQGSHRLGGIPSSMGSGTNIAVKFPNGAPCTQYMDKTLSHGMSISFPNSLPSLLRLESVGNQSNLSETNHLQNQMNIEFRGSPNCHPNSLPKYHDGLTNLTPSNSPGGIGTNINARPSDLMDSRQYSRLGSNGHSIDLNEGVFGPTGNGGCPTPGNPYAWSSSPQRQPQRMMWPNSPSFVSGICAARPQLHGVPGTPSHMLSALLPVNNHHVGSAPSVNHSLWDRRQAYTGESPDASVFHPGSLGSLRISGNSPQPLEFVPHNIFSPGNGSCMDLPIPSKNVGLHSPHQRCMMFPSRGQMIPMMNAFDSPTGRTRSRRNEGTSSQTDNKKQFELDIDRIMRGDDKRTTLMIKNIPNKYTSKMLLAAIDERHRGSYDFIYLPIDFKNKCNVGYAFINMTEPSLIIPFYQSFNGKKWEKFNSEKVASLAYARIQGKAALIAHFQNSSLMNEDKRCRPILFHTDGPNAGDQVPFPMGVNVRSRPGKGRIGTSEENNQGSHTSPTNGESSGDSSSVSLNESN